MVQLMKYPVLGTVTGKDGISKADEKGNFNLSRSRHSVGHLPNLARVRTASYSACSGLGLLWQSHLLGGSQEWDKSHLHSLPLV